jgi:hypothetical protein
MQPADPGQISTDPTSGQDAAILSQQADIMMSLGPIDPDLQHRRPPFVSSSSLTEPEKTHAARMAVLNGTTSHQASRLLTNRPGHALP